MNENISYILDENDNTNENIITDISQIIQNFENIELQENTIGMDDLYVSFTNYDENYNVKQLQQICEFYGIKCGKVKKIDIIGEIVMFENDTSNIEIVLKRHQFWDYMKELKEDKFMRKFIIWS